MRRLKSLLAVTILVTAFVTVNAGVAAADGSGGDWYDGEYGDEWAPEDALDDPWVDDGWAEDEWADDGLNDGWTDIEPASAEAAVASMNVALDTCFDSDSSDLTECILDAVDVLFAQLFPIDDIFGELPQDEVDPQWDDELDDAPGPDDSFEDDLEPVDDPDAWASIKGRFDELIPAEWRERIVDFQLESDGRDGIVAAVEPLSDDLSQWSLFVDPADADHELDSTLIHEFAHVMTLNESQIDGQLAASDREYDRAASSCGTYFTGEGCALPGSYMARFVDRFWDPILPEFRRIEQIEDETAWEEAMFDFLDKRADEFVTDYAAANPAEDMSETFAAFVLAPELPDGDTIAEQKILFFNQFDELVALRDSIRRAL